MCHGISETGHPLFMFLADDLFMKPDRARVSTTVLKTKILERIDLVYPQGQNSDAPPEEVILSVQGYLVQSKLPPILNSHR